MKNRFHRLSVSCASVIMMSSVFSLSGCDSGPSPSLKRVIMDGTSANYYVHYAPSNPSAWGETLLSDVYDLAKANPSWTSITVKVYYPRGEWKDAYGDPLPSGQALWIDDISFYDLQEVRRYKEKRFFTADSKSSIGRFIWVLGDRGPSRLAINLQVQVALGYK